MAKHATTTIISYHAHSAGGLLMARLPLLLRAGGLEREAAVLCCVPWLRSDGRRRGDTGRLEGHPRPLRQHPWQQGMGFTSAAQRVS